MLSDNKGTEYQQRLQNVRFHRLSSVSLGRYIEIFNCVYENLNIHKASKQVHASISTVSRSIAILEDIIGEKFFQRKGRGGMLTTKDGEKFYSYAKQYLKTLNTINNINFKNDKNDSCLINIDAHPLAPKIYIFPAIHCLLNERQKDTVNTVKCNLNISSKKEAINNIKNDISDIAIYPMENEEYNILESDSDIYQIKRLKEYNLCLYLNKQNKFASINEKIIEISDLNRINIAPYNISSRFNTFIKTLKSNSYFLNTSSLDLNMLYEGIVNNFWAVGIGDEFEKVFDCANFAKKNYKNTNCCSVKIYWVIISKKQQQKSYINSIIDAIIAEFQKYYKKDL